MTEESWKPTLKSNSKPKRSQHQLLQPTQRALRTMMPVRVQTSTMMTTLNQSPRVKVYRAACCRVQTCHKCRARQLQHRSNNPFKSSQPLTTRGRISNNNYLRQHTRACWRPILRRRINSPRLMKASIHTSRRKTQRYQLGQHSRSGVWVRI